MEGGAAVGSEALAGFQAHRMRFIFLFELISKCAPPPRKSNSPTGGPQQEAAACFIATHTHQILFVGFLCF